MILAGTTVSVDENGTPSETIFVLARTRRIFRQWCEERYINPDSPRMIYVTEPLHFAGGKTGWVKDLGTSSYRADEIYCILAMGLYIGCFNQIEL